VWGAGESITLSGIAARHARLLGFKNTHVEGQVARNLIAVGSTVVIDKQASVEGSAVVAGQDVLIDGTVRGKTRIYGNRVTLSGAFDDEVSIVASDINILPGTHIAGDLRYMMDKDLILDGRVALDGKLVRMEPKVAASSPGLSWSTVLFQIGLCLAAILVGMAFANFFPSMVAMSVQKLAESFWRSLLVGFVAFCLIPMTAFFLIFTLVGLPLSILLIMGYLIMIYLGKIVAALYLGHSILRRRRDRPPASLLAPLMLGLVTLYTVALAPFPIDILVWFSFTLLGLGGLAGAIMDRRTPIMVACPPPSAPTGEAK
jgi:cytoskeletal protein CcmA (bactofilin family)